jgi:hypothetical protein
LGLPRTQASPFDTMLRSETPALTHITSQCPGTLCYIPGPEDWTNGGVNAAFRHTDNVGFQNHQNFGAYNQHPSLRHGIPSPPASHQPVTRLGAGFSSEVVANLSSRLGFSPAGEYEFISARLCPLWFSKILHREYQKSTMFWSLQLQIPETQSLNCFHARYLGQSCHQTATSIIRAPPLISMRSFRDLVRKSLRNSSNSRHSETAN